MTATPFTATSMPDADWWQALWPDPGAVLSRLGVAHHGRAIDLCCGDGLFTVPLASLAREVVAIDLDPAMLRLARAQARAAGRRNIFYVVADAYDVAQMLAGSFAFVLIANTFHGAAEKTRLARKIHAVLAPEGRFAVINWHRLPREETAVLGKPRGPRTGLRMTPEELAAVVQPAGFRLASLLELPPYHYAAIFAAGSPTRGCPTRGCPTRG